MGNYYMIQITLPKHRMESSGIITIKVPNEELLEQMIEEEESIRTSQWYQTRCTEVRDIVNGWLDVTEQMQVDLVKRHGFTDQISCDVTCNMLRRAHILYPDNPKFRAPLYVRNNKANSGTLQVGDTIPNISIHDLDGSPITLHQLIEQPTILLMTSAT